MTKLFKKLNEQLEINQIKNSIVVTAEDENRIIFGESSYENILEEEGYYGGYKLGAISNPFRKDDTKEKEAAENAKNEEYNKILSFYMDSMDDIKGKIEAEVSRYKLQLSRLETKYGKAIPEGELDKLDKALVSAFASFKKDVEYQNKRFSGKIKESDKVTFNSDFFKKSWSGYGWAAN